MGSVVIGLTGCASVTEPATQTVSIRLVDDAGQPVTGQCQLDNDSGRWALATPGQVRINRSSSDLMVSCESAGPVVSVARVTSGIDPDKTGSIWLLSLAGYGSDVYNSMNSGVYAYPDQIQPIQGQRIMVNPAFSAKP